MDDIIALVCPSCGGKVQVEKNLEKMFCTHCGTQLLLRQGADGLLTPMMARELNASAQLKETQNTMIVIEMLKGQIKELEERARGLRKAFFSFGYAHVFYYKSLSHLRKTLETYQKNIGISPKTYESAIHSSVKMVNPGFFQGMEYPLNIDGLMATSTPGCNTPDDLLKIYLFIT